MNRIVLLSLVLAACTRGASEPLPIPGPQAVRSEPLAIAPPQDAPDARRRAPRAAPRPRPAPRLSPRPASKPSITSTETRDAWDGLAVAEVPAQAPAFGGSTWLSNDDSTSLASAQRLLWALQEGEPIGPEEIRKHELLNYFHFDTLAPEEGETFEITASAVVEGDTFALALAVQGASPARLPLDLTLLIDRSCSMKREDRLQTTQRALRRMAEQLQPGDRVDLITFAERADVLVDDLDVGRNPQALRAAIEKIRPLGGTDLDAGLQAAYRLAAARPADRNRNRRVLLITDAELNQGRVDVATVTEVGRHLEERGIRLTGVGVGRTFDDRVLDTLTEKGKGAYVYLGSDAVVDRMFGEGFPALVSTIAHDVRFQLHLPPSLAMTRFYGEEASTVREDVKPVHFFAGTSQLFLQDLTLGEDGLVPTDLIELDVTWRDPTTDEPESRKFSVRVGDVLFADPTNAHKARALMAWTDALSTRALGGRCSAERFDVLAARASDPELDYAGRLLQEVCPRTMRAARR